MTSNRQAMRCSGSRKLVAVLLALTLGACGTLSVQQEKDLGHQVQRQVREQYTMMRDRVVVSYVRGLGDELAASARPSPFNFRFFVVEDESLNAFAVPGGAIYVNTGLILEVDNAAELAGVIAHEIGHVTARHVAQNANRQRATGMLANVTAIVVGILTGSNIGAQGGAIASSIAAQAYLSSYTRTAEREADTLAIETLVRGGWDPYAMVSMFEKLMEEGRSGPRMPQFLSSHPATPERIQRVKSLIAAEGALPRLRTDDGGRLPIIQERIRLIAGTDQGEVE